MSRRWVINGTNGWLNARAAIVRWDQERRRLHYDGPLLQTGLDALPVQLRWLLHPAIGLPSQPFVIWRNHHPGGTPSAQELAICPAGSRSRPSACRWTNHGPTPATPWTSRVRARLR